MADKGLIAASASLAKSQIPVDLAGEFMETFGEATKKFEADRQAIISTVSDYMGRLKTDIDFTSMAPAMETEVRGFLTNRKNEYAELANQVAKLKDPSSKEYQAAVDRMNDIQREFQVLSKELATYNQQKVDFAADFKDPQNAFSGANSDADLAAYRDIYGLSENGVAPVIIDNGHLQFNVGGKIKRYDSMEDLLRPDNTPLIIAEQAANYSGLNREITQKELDFESAQLDTLFKNNKSFASLIFDAPKELELFEIREEYIKAREEGKLEELLPELKNRAKDIIINGYKDTALESKAAYDARTDDPSDAPKYSGEGAYMIAHYNNGRNFIPYPGTNNTGYFMVDKSGNRIEGTGTGGIFTKQDRKKAVGYQRFTKIKGKGWLTDGTYPVVPLDNQKEFYLQNNNIIKYG
jgi:hypothetical protein